MQWLYDALKKLEAESKTFAYSDNNEVTEAYRIGWSEALFSMKEIIDKEYKAVTKRLQQSLKKSREKQQ